MRLRIPTLFALLACLLLASALVGCGKHADGGSSKADDEAATSPADATASPTAMDVVVPLSTQSGPRVSLHTSMGDIVIELYPNKAPKTVANFLAYVNEGFYNGTVFNRVIDDLLIQGGAYTPDMQKKGGVHAAIPDEANNGLSNQRGTVAAARALAPGSATSEFFINLVDNPRFDYVSDADATTAGYAVFGKVVSGMDVVDKIRLVKTHGQGKFTSDVPVTPVVIEKAEALPPADGH